MRRLHPDQRDRVVSATAVAVIHAALGLLLLRGLGVELSAPVEAIPKMFDVLEPPPPPPPAEPAKPAKPEPAKRETHKPKDPEGAAAPPNKRSTPAPVVMPTPPVPMPVPQVVAAKVAGEDNKPAAGAAELPGPGTGAGGVGDGRGSGESGDGTGGGGGGGLARDLLWVGGRIGNRDYPRGAYDAGAQGTVFVRFIVTTRGRVRDCEVTRSSGNRALDVGTCRLIESRLRYRPKLDRSGRPVEAEVIGEHEWTLRRGRDTWVEPTIEDE